MPAKKGHKWILWVLLGVGIIVAWNAIAFLSDSGDDGDSTAPRSVPQSESQQDDRQTYYNAFLGEARQQLRETGETIYCEPDYWYLVASQVTGADAGERTLIQLAMGDACKETGALSDAARYSSYHDDAP